MTSSTVLLVDDDAQFRQLIAGALSARGHTVVEAATGHDGMQAMSKHQPGVVIIDGLLPDGDGLKWIPKLREARADVPIVFVSSFYRDMGSFKRLNDELRVALIAHKPIEPATFVAQIDALLGTAPPTTANDELAAQLEVWKREYSEQLPGHVEELQAALKRVHSSAADEAAWDLARDRAHKIRGTAGSFGLMPVTDAAATIEDALLALKGLAPELARPHWQNIDRAFKGLPQRQLAPPPLPSPQTMPSDIVIMVGGDAIASRALVTRGRAHNYAVVQVAGLEALIERAKARVPAAVLVDMNGRNPEALGHIAANLRAIPGAENVSIAFIESQTESVSEAQALHAGATLRLAAGLTADAIAAALGRMLLARPQQTRVLVVDDDVNFGKLVLDILGPRGITARHISDPERLFEALEELQPDLVLLDMVMPQMSGIELCKKIRASPTWRHTSVLPEWDPS